MKRWVGKRKSGKKDWRAWTFWHDRRDECSIKDASRVCKDTRTGDPCS